MAEQWFQDFNFRGTRPYIHSASICNHLQTRFGAVTQFEITFKTWMAARVIFWADPEPDAPPPDGLAPKGSFSFTGADGRRVFGGLTDDPAHPTLTREAYDEDALMADATRTDRVMTCPPAFNGTITERMVAANKQLILRALNPGVKLIAAKLSFARFLPDAAGFQMRLDSHLGTRIFKSSLLKDDQKIGELVYYGQ